MRTRREGSSGKSAYRHGFGPGRRSLLDENYLHATGQPAPATSLRDVLSRIVRTALRLRVRALVGGVVVAALVLLLVVLV